MHGRIKKKKVKVESLGDNVFMFKFGVEVDKKRALKEGPWHFASALIVFAEPKGNWKYIKAVFYLCILLDTTPKCAHNVHGQRDNIKTCGGY